jgi:hypothetical protein
LSIRRRAFSIFIRYGLVSASHLSIKNRRVRKYKSLLEIAYQETNHNCSADNSNHK